MTLGLAEGGSRDHRGAQEQERKVLGWLLRVRPQGTDTSGLGDLLLLPSS